MLSEDVKAWHSKLCDMSTHEIVKLMVDENIRAIPKHSGWCAVSTFIKKKTGEEVLTSREYITDGLNWDTTQQREILPHSVSVARFIEGFDAGNYPELVIGDARG